MADEVDRRIGQEGSRWYNQMPSGADVAEWFKENVKVHDGLDHADYVQGVTLIPGTEKSKSIVGWTDTAPVIATVENLVYTPYAKVETRVKYWHDLMAEKDDWLGVIEPMDIVGSPLAGFPPGFFRYSVQTDSGLVNYICCAMKVTVFKRETVKYKEFRNVETKKMELLREGETIIDAAPATKMIATMRKYGPDEFAIMKAETGAVGRALGMAGMLVIPGTGIATAEDMQEAQGLEGGRGAAPEPEEVKPPADVEGAPQEVTEEVLTQLRQQAISIINQLKNDYPEVFEEFKEWAQARQIGEVAKVADPRVLEGMIRKADRDYTEAAGKAKAADSAAPAGE